MQKFEYREPRFAADLPARFIQEDNTWAGRCREISKQGATLELDKPVPAGTAGTISLSFQSKTLEVRAKVTHAEGRRGGFVFLYEADTERAAIAQLVSALAITVKRPGPVIVHPTDR